VLGLAIERGVRIVVNAGGLNPAGLAERLRALAGKLGVAAKVAHVEGDDLLPRLGELQAQGVPLKHLDTGRDLAAAGVAPVTANAYLGAWGIVAALDSGADVVVCPRVTDASLVVGPAAFHFGWRQDDWDRLAGAVVAATSSSADRRRPAATTASSARCRGSSTRVFRSPRSLRTAAR
jgi:hypothetical protein